MTNPKFPLVELHRHLDGNVRLETILDVGLKNDIDLPARTLDGLRPYVQVTEPKPSILSFFEKFKWLTLAMVDYDTCSRIAYENVEDAKNEGIDYIELRFSPWFMAEAHQLEPAGVTEAVVDGIQRGVRDHQISAKIIGIISRTYGPEICFKELNAILSQKEHIVALDLAGDEANYPAYLFVEHFNIARNAGLLSCPHAGEAAGPESIWQAINLLGADRIGHAVTAPQDPILMEYLADNNICIESCLTSNIQTTTVPDYDGHPIKAFLTAGIKASISTDDPGISAIDINHEYQVAAENVGLTQDEIYLLQQNALACAFLSKAEKEALIQAKKK
ncbi:MAG: adenosine deaminase [Anaerolineaceae bacterium]|nr:adenosine deaminase [Anaerolineaceae bacterium]